MGSCASFFYIRQIKEVKLSEAAEKYDDIYLQHHPQLVIKLESNEAVMGKNWKAWLKEGTFYVHGMIYMFVRIAINVSMTMMPFYLQAVIGFGKAKIDQESDPTAPQLAIVPLISYILGLIFSIFV